jgi:hypothetical protein
MAQKEMSHRKYFSHYSLFFHQGCLICSAATTMETTMTIAEFHNGKHHGASPESVSARWFSAAIILGTGFLAMALISFAFA